MSKWRFSKSASSRPSSTMPPAIEMGTLSTYFEWLRAAECAAELLLPVLPPALDLLPYKDMLGAS